jgi:hypothetical protein
MGEHVVHTGIPLYTMYTHRITGSVVEGSVEVQIPVGLSLKYDPLPLSPLSANLQMKR